MKKIKVIAIASFLSLSFVVNGTGNPKIMVLHNGFPIEVSPNALNAHLAHGDAQLFEYMGQWLTIEQINALLYPGGTPGTIGG